MNYDTQMVWSLVIFFGLYTLWIILILPSYNFLTSFCIVRKSVWADMTKRYSDMERKNELLKKGIFISQEESGQLKFDLPTEVVPDYVRLPYVQNDKVWCQFWLPEDYAAYRSGKTWVRRGRKKLWVDVPLTNDKVLNELPYEEYCYGKAS